MKEELLKDLVEKTFAVVASPLQSNGIYAAIQKAVAMAYAIGQEKTGTEAGREILIEQLGH